MTEQQKFYGWYIVAALWLIYLINVGFIFYGSNVINTSCPVDHKYESKYVDACIV